MSTTLPIAMPIGDLEALLHEQLWLLDGEAALKTTEHFDSALRKGYIDCHAEAFVDFLTRAIVAHRLYNGPSATVYYNRLRQVAARQNLDILALERQIDRLDLDYHDQPLSWVKYARYLRLKFTARFGRRKRLARS